MAFVNVSADGNALHWSYSEENDEGDVVLVDSTRTHVLPLRTLVDVRPSDSLASLSSNDVFVLRITVQDGGELNIIAPSNTEFSVWFYGLAFLQVKHILARLTSTSADYRCNLTRAYFQRLMNPSDGADDCEGQVPSRLPILQPTSLLIASSQQEGDDSTQSSNGLRLFPSNDSICLLWPCADCVAAAPPPVLKMSAA